MSKVNSKNFAKTLGLVVKQFGTFRANLQSLCDFAMSQAANGNYTYINAIMNADLKGSDQRAVQRYFEDHCDVTLGRKDGKFAFSNNKTRGFKYKAPTKGWHEYKPTAAPSVIDPVEALLSAVTRITNAIEHKGSASIAKGKVQLAKQLAATVTAIPEVKALKASKATAKAA